MATTDNQYYSEFEGRSTGPSTLGENRFITLEDIINNYMVLYMDEDNHGMTSRLKVEAFAQRAIQEYSYDTFRVKTWEYEVIDRATFPMPQDFVELVGMNYVDERGRERWVNPRKDSSNPRSPFQFNETEDWDETAIYLAGDPVRYTPAGEQAPRIYYAIAGTQSDPNQGEQPDVMDSDWWQEGSYGETGYIYNSDGNIIFAEDTSYTKTQNDEYNRRQTILNGDLDDGSFVNGIYYGYYGRRFYSETERANANPTYYINDRNGVIDLDPVLIGEVINLTYVSDGLSSDLSEIKVHKFAEQAIYESIYFEMIARSSKIPANEKERAKRRMVAKHRQTKLRLMDISPRQLLQTLRAQAKWIKT